MENDNSELLTNIDQGPSLRELLARKRARNEKSFVELRAERLKKIKEEFNLPGKGYLYYPACGEDNSPSLAFPEWTVFYMDAENTNISRFSNDNVVIKGDLMNPPFESKQEQFDVVMLVSPGNHFVDFSPDYIKKAVESLKTNGLLICDDYHGTASDIRENLKSTFKEVGENQLELKVFQKMDNGI